MSTDKDRVILEIDIKGTLDGQSLDELNDLICSKMLEAGIPVICNELPFSKFKTYAGISAGYITAYDDPINNTRVIDWSRYKIIH